MTKAALKLGLCSIGFTGHSHTPCDLSYCMSSKGTEQYQVEIAGLKRRYRGQIDILCGLEWDLLSDTDPEKFEYFIGSVHYIRGPETGRYYAVDWQKEELRACMEQEFSGDGLAMADHYFSQVTEVSEKCPDILGHFDLIKKLNGKGEFFDENAPRYRKAALEALDKAFLNCHLLEINTGAASRGYRNDFYPADFLLKRWQELGGDVIITADSHSVDTLTAYYDEAVEAAKKAGFSRVMVLTKNGFEECKLV